MGKQLGEWKVRRGVERKGKNVVEIGQILLFTENLEKRVRSEACDVQKSGRRERRWAEG